jgi:O-Antigen ligase
MSATLPLAQKPSLGFTVEQIRIVFVWLIFASSFVVTIEPAPCDIIFILTFAFYLMTGQNMQLAVAPLVLLLLLYNIGGLTSFIQVSNDTRAQTLVITSFYMAGSAIFFACFIAEDTNRRMAIIKNGYIIGATIAAICGILGRLDIAGLADVFTMESRATGLFKDPNVFSTYLVLPTAMLLQGFMLGTVRHKLLSLTSLLLLITAILLAFSRGAWINLSMATILILGFTFMLTPSNAMRGRILIFTIATVLVVGVILTLLLSIPEIRDLFADRFTLVKNYDAGETGRFGNQLNAIPMLLVRPLGFGPAHFYEIFRLDPHNTFLNSFASYGWLGGVTYFVLIISTLIIGTRSILSKSPWQNNAILLFSCMVAVMFQGVQIDTEHWRHFYWMLGLNWGLFAATLNYRAQQSNE